ncbi:snRNA-activating protein complex subunit 3-like [Mercenaria mercenaria]|uniref:snRNA-activating protein complex subunit 3-like n=1 Tax=Mercenaria mercenaria TaxID=6596 RepID=UPI00234EFBEB|nr:snRNA-activating protein complex subunit 3-like [Mercenaria mercenaria]
MAASTEKINVREFLSKWDNDVYHTCAEESKSDVETLTKKLKMSAENVKELENVCSLDLLEPDTEERHLYDKWEYLENIPGDAKLMCVRFQKQELERRNQNSAHLIAVYRKFKYRQTDEHLMYDPGPDGSKLKDIPEDCRVIYPDVVLTVHIHRPSKVKMAKKLYEEQGKYEAPFLSNTLLVLGRQKLTDLRDMVRCVHDLTVAGDMSENPDMDCQVYAKDVFKSGFFFINDVFYNDLREDDARDYSKEIREWASQPPRNKNYETKRMEDTTFLDLTVKLGAPYLYMHQGDCQHLLVFSDIRLLTTEEPQDLRMYPYMIGRSNRHRTLCRVCGNQAARWITYNSQFTPENPCFFCDLCFRCLNYDSNNKKIGNFEAYRYFDHHAIV